MKIAVSFLSSNYDEAESIRRLNETDADYLHLDVADGHFVNNKTPEFTHLAESKKPLDIHLMVSNAFEYISKYASLDNTENITIHVELEDDLKSLLNYIKSRGIKCGLAINPETSIDTLEDYLNIIDTVLVMTVNPGFGGQQLIEKCLDKITALNDLRQKKDYKFQIIVDGGINDKTISKIKNADIVVSGSYICKSENFGEKINQLRLSKTSIK